MIKRAEIEQRLPQKGRMCLLDAVVEVTEQAICCLADVSRNDHPLREASGVPAEHAIEYAAQAAALHRGLMHETSTVAAGGRLLQVRRAEFHVQWLDRLPQPLRVSAHRVLATSEAANYAFELRAGPTLAAHGELTLRLSAAPRAEQNDAEA